MGGQSIPEKRKKILLVDDEQFIRRLTRTTLDSDYYEIFEAENGQEAMKLANDVLPDLILLDLKMPDFSGLHISREIRKDSRFEDTYIIILTGEMDEEMRKLGLEAGANDFFTKPFSPVQLLDKIHAYFNKDEHKLVFSHKTNHKPASIPQEESYKLHTWEELSRLENDQLMIYAHDLCRVYQQEIHKTKELNKAYEKLKEMEKMKDVFIALVSHELKTPLSVIKGYLYLLSEVLNRSAIKDDISSFMNPISKAIERLEELMGELLDFSRMKSGLMTFQKREINIPVFVKLIVKDLQAQFDSKNIKVNVEVKGDFRPIKADYDRLKEAFTHLIKNALNFTDPDGSFTIECKDEGVWVVIDMKDTGKGIPEDKMDKIFNPFYQTADFLTREVGGLGLGLPITKHIIEDHGGTISVESEMGKGSTFTIKLPRSYQDVKEIVTELKQTYPQQIEELTKNLQKTQEQLLSYTENLSDGYAREHQRVEQLEESLNAMEHSYVQTIAALARTVDLKDAYTGGHTDRVSFYAYAIARNLNPELLHDRNFKYSLLLHDIGKIGIAEDIMGKAEKLTDEEWQILKGHPQKAVEILKGIEFLMPALSAVRSHHERWDGKGYPDGLRGEEIPLAARIIALADAFDAMTTNRPYRKGMSMEEAREEIQSLSGLQFDPQVVEKFFISWEEITTFAGQVNKVIDLERQMIDVG
ncbi:MAG: response regulator [Firmicutes bacterium]|nr:response regulator [Bacillota bacterium]